MLVKKIDIADVNDLNSVAERMTVLENNAIGYVNWCDRFPSTAEVYFKMAHNGECLFLHYFVEENEVLANVTEDNGAVWTDSCVEFFISFGNSAYYYNAEFTCTGKALLGYRKDRDNVEKATENVLSSIKRLASLGTEPFGRKEGCLLWNILIAIPASAYWRSGLNTFDGIKARANFYKCGDNLIRPHYLSWKEIKSDKPNFHLPEFFGELEFED